MTRSLYSPPVAAVADLVAEKPARPGHVRVAIGLLLVAYSSGVVSFLVRGGPGLAARLQTELKISLLASSLFGLAVAAVLLRYIYVGRNWARIVLALLTLISVPSALSPIILNFRFDRPGRGVFLLAQLLLVAVALCLLFLPKSNRWFRKPKS